MISTPTRRPTALLAAGLILLALSGCAVKLAAPGLSYESTVHWPQALDWNDGRLVVSDTAEPSPP